MTKKLLAALMGTFFAFGALSSSAVFADEGTDDKKETTQEEKK